MEVIGAIFPKRYANEITRHEQKEKIFPHETSIVNKRKQIEDRKTFVVSNLVSIMSSPSKKAYQNEVHTINYLLQCSMSSAYCWGGKDSTKCGHFIAQVHNAAMKWSIKPCIVRTKKVINALR